MLQNGERVIAPRDEVGECGTVGVSKMADLHRFHDAGVTQLQQHFVRVEIRRTV